MSDSAQYDRYSGEIFLRKNSKNPAKSGLKSNIINPSGPGRLEL